MKQSLFPGHDCKHQAGQEWEGSRELACLRRLKARRVFIHRIVVHVGMMGPLDPKTDTVQRQFTALTDPSDGYTLHQAGPRRHTPGSAGRWGDPERGCILVFLGDKWANARQTG